MIIADVKQRDNGLLDHIRRVTNRYAATIEVGYLSNQMYKYPIGARRPKNPPPITMKALANRHEQGWGVPERPFIGPSFAKNRRKYAVLAKKQITPIFRRKKTLNQGWNEIGQMAIEDIRDYMKVRGNFQPLSPITIWRKQSDFPLLDTGQLREELEYKVKK